MDLKIRPIKNNVFYIGSKDANRQLFDQLVPLPQGTTYNSYLVKGSEKTAIVDTDYPKKLDEYKKKTARKQYYQCRLHYLKPRRTRPLRRNPHAFGDVSAGKSCDKCKS